MPVTEGFVTVLVHEDIRRILKHVSAESAVPMYSILAELVYQAFPQYTHPSSPTPEIPEHARQ